MVNRAIGKVSKLGLQIYGHTYSMYEEAPFGQCLDFSLLYVNSDGVEDHTIEIR